MKNIDKIIKELIPPADYSHRNGFSNYHIVDSLSEVEKNKVEQKLINMLKHSDDSLIGETLSYLKARNALPILEEKLEKEEDSSLKITWANIIFKIKPDIRLADIAFQEFQKIKDRYLLIYTFHLLVEFQDSRINKSIAKYRYHRDYLIAHNARTALRSQKPFWKFWWKLWQ